jgi:hypothetical protein
LTLNCIRTQNPNSVNKIVAILNSLKVMELVKFQKKFFVQTLVPPPFFSGGVWTQGFILARGTLTLEPHLGRLLALKRFFSLSW